MDRNARGLADLTADAQAAGKPTLARYVTWLEDRVAALEAEARQHHAMFDELHSVYRPERAP